MEKNIGNWEYIDLKVTQYNIFPFRDSILCQFLPTWIGMNMLSDLISMTRIWRQDVGKKTNFLAREENINEWQYEHDDISKDTAASWNGDILTKTK